MRGGTERARAIVQTRDRWTVDRRSPEQCHGVATMAASAAGADQSRAEPATELEWSRARASISSAQTAARRTRARARVKNHLRAPSVSEMDVERGCACNCCTARFPHARQRRTKGMGSFRLSTAPHIAAEPLTLLEGSFTMPSSSAKWRAQKPCSCTAISSPHSAEKS